jgi:hypothetical protein
MPAAEFKHATPTSERLYSLALECAATVLPTKHLILRIMCFIIVHIWSAVWNIVILQKIQASHMVKTPSLVELED